MAYIFNVQIPDEKQVPFSLKKIEGIGTHTSKLILNQLGISHTIKTKNLKETQLNKIKNIIQSNYIIKRELKQKTNANIQTLVEIGCYRGLRHNLSLPVRGQRTHTNAKTQKQLGRSRFKSIKTKNN